MNGKNLIISLLLFASLLGAILATDSFFGDQGREVLQRGVSSSVLRYGTLGKSLSELGLLSGYREEEYLPVHLSTLEEGQARLSFMLESHKPVGGHVFFRRKNSDGGPGPIEMRNLLNERAGNVAHAFDFFPLEDLFAIRIDIDTLNAQVKISNIEVIDHNLEFLNLDGKWAYEALVPNEKLVVESLDDNSITFSTLASGDGDAQLFLAVHELQIRHNGFASLFGRKRTQSDISYKANRLSDGPADLPSHISHQGLGIPILSIHAADDKFIDAYGIITNIEERGREFERLADITYYDATGSKVYASSVGIRYHGGYNRAKYDSYKFYFRGVYGSTEQKQSLMFPEPLMPIKSFVLHHTKFPEYSPIGHLLAIDLFEAMGVDTPRRQPAMVYLNGQELGFYYITDHLSRRNFNAYFGTEDFRFYRFKSYNPDEDTKALNKDLGPIVSYKGEPGEFPEEYIYEHFDVEGITNFMIANTVLNVHDYCQGVLYRRDDLGEEKWRMVGWDFDGAFMKVGDWTVPNPEDTFNIVGEAYSMSRECPYQIIFRRLLRYSADYREYFKQRFHQSLETVFSTESMQARLADYREKYQGKFGVDVQGLDMLHEYFEKRPEFIRKQTDEHLAHWETITE